jgi:hypothetical protein
MSRLETIARGIIVIGLVAGAATAALVLGGRLLGGSDAPPSSDIGPLLGIATVVHERVRDDLAPGDRDGRSVLLAVPEAPTPQAAVNGLLRLLRSAGWIVSSRGGAVSADGELCIVLRTAQAWLDDAANAGLRDEFEARVAETREAAVVADLFFC